MRTRPYAALGVVATVAAVVLPLGPNVVGAQPVRVRGTVTAVSAAPVATTPSPPARAGVGGTGFRRVADVLREASQARSGAARSIDPDLLAVAHDPTAFVDSNGRLLYIEQVEPSREDAATPRPEPVDGSGGSVLGLVAGRSGLDANATSDPATPTGPPEAASPIPAAATDPEVAAGVYLPTGNTFFLNSRPGSTKTIYLDFDGYTLSGTAWNAETGIFSQTVAPYDYDGFAGLSATDEQVIRAIWQAVAEDFAAFDVNVTTQQPSDAALYRSSVGDNTYGSIAVITPQKWMPSICGGGCGGVAYVDIFGEYRNGFQTTTPADRYYAPAWVFASSGSNWTSVADTISHEVGHNLGLSHDGLRNTGVSPCFSTVEYFSGNGSGTGSWGPIMGSPFGRQYTQWSRGEYSCASQTQDDVAIINAKTGPVLDESSAIGNAVPLPTDETATADQIIGLGGDLDLFWIDVTTNYLKVTVTRSLNGSSLYPRVGMLYASGLEFRSGLISSGSTLELEAFPLGPSVRVYISVEGIGLNSPAAGFSNYASSGFYNVSAEVYAPVSAPYSPLLVPSGNQVFTASWGKPSAKSWLAPFTYSVSLCNASNQSCSAPVELSSTADNPSVQLAAPTPTGSYYFTVNARQVANRVGPNATSAPVAVLTAPIAPSPVRLVYDAFADTVTVVWAGGQEFAPVSVIGRTLTVVNRSGGATVFTQSGLAAGGSVTFSTASVPDGVWLDASLASQTGYGSPWNVSPSSPTGSVFLGRLAAPQTPGPSTTAPRPGAPQTPGTTVPGRPTAPQV